MHKNILLGQSFKDNTELNISVGKWFENIMKAVEEIAYPTVAEITKGKKADAILWQFSMKVVTIPVYG